MIRILLRREDLMQLLHLQFIYAGSLWLEAWVTDEQLALLNVPYSRL